MKNNGETKREWRFYVTLILGYALLVWGFITPPPGVISSSVLMAAGVLFCIGSMAVGIDLKGIIHEFRMLKKDIDDQDNGE